MTWTFNNEILEITPEDLTGFVYIITCKLTNRKYIGKKLFYFAKTSSKMVTLKNGTKKKKKIKSKVESDWKTYWSSSEELKKDVATLGEHNFTREILFLCKSKAECSYREAEEQFKREVLKFSNEWYNGIISIRVHKNHINF